MFKLLKYLKPYKFQCLALVIFIAIQTWFTLMLPSEMAKIVNKGIAENDTNFIFLTGAKMLAYTLIASVCAVLSGYFSATIGANSHAICAKIFIKKS